MKRFAMSLILALSLFSVNTPAFAQLPPYKECIGIAESILNIGQARIDGFTKKEAIEFYGQALAGNKPSAFNLRVYLMIEEVFKFKNLETLENLMDFAKKEYDLCNSVKGDYSKPKGI